MVQVRVCDEAGRRAHEVPRLAAEIEIELQFIDAPVRLDSRPRPAFDGDPIKSFRLHGDVVDHRMSESWRSGCDYLSCHAQRLSRNSILRHRIAKPSVISEARSVSRNATAAASLGRKSQEMLSIVVDAKFVVITELFQLEHRSLKS